MCVTDETDVQVRTLRELVSVRSGEPLAVCGGALRGRPSARNASGDNADIASLNPRDENVDGRIHSESTFMLSSAKSKLVRTLVLTTFLGLFFLILSVLIAFLSRFSLAEAMVFVYGS